MIKKLYVINNKVYDVSNLENAIEIVNNLTNEQVKQIFNKTCLRKLRPQDITNSLLNEFVSESIDGFSIKTYTVCDICKHIINDNDNHYNGGVNIVYCEHCKSTRNLQPCACCGSYIQQNYLTQCNIYNEEGNLIKTVKICESCGHYSKKLDGVPIKRCYVCDEYYTVPHNYNATREACPRCILSERYRCHSCEHIYSTQDMHDETECHACYERNAKRECLKSYSYKPAPEFKKTDHERINEYMGIEFETELKSSSIIEPIDLAFLTNDLDYMYAKTDGSLDNGVEFVTHPITYKAWRETYLDKFEEDIIQKAKDNIKNRPLNAGIHIHVTRECLGKSSTERNLNIKKICYLLSKAENYKLLTKFAQRDDERIRRWARPYEIHYAHDINNAIHLDDSRYHVVNLQNSNTIEFRCFASVANIKAIKAFIIFVHNVIKYCKDHTSEEILSTKLEDVIYYTEKSFMEKYMKEVS